MNSIKKNKNKVREEILKYVEERVKNGTYPTRDVIAKEFKIGLRHYFKNMRYLYEQIHIRENVRISPSKLAKKYFKEIIKDFIKKKISVGHYPGRKEIERHFKIDIRSVFYNSTRERLTLEKLYEKLGFPKEFAKNAKHNSISNSRPESFAFENLEEGKNKIINFIHEEFKKGKIPTRFDIQHKFKINLNTYFPYLKDAYNLAEVPYDRPELNIIFSKERKLTEVAKSIFLKKGYKIIKISIEAKSNRNRGPDLIIEDKNKNCILVELKAYHKNNPIGNIEVNQLKGYLKELQIKKGIVMTTSDKIESDVNLSNNISILPYTALITLLEELSLNKFILDLDWIRSSYATKSRDKFAIRIKKEIIEFIRQEFSQGRFPYRNKLQKKFNVHIETYFDCNSIYDLFKLLNIEVPIKCRTPEEKKNLIIDYIKEKFHKEKKLATRTEIEKKFKVSLTHYFGKDNTLMKVYQAASVPVPPRFFPKEQVIRKIAEYVKNKLDNNEIILKKDIQSKFGICPEGLIRKKFMQNIVEIAQNLDSS